jgi:hypothetical protein
LSVPSGFAPPAASVIRRWARAPAGSALGRSVGDEQRQHDRVGVLGDLSVQPQQHGLPRPGLAETHLGVQPGVLRAAARDDAEDPARVLARGLGRRAQGVVLRRLVGHDHQRQHRAGGGLADPVPGIGQRVLDVPGVGVHEIDDHAGFTSAWAYGRLAGLGHTGPVGRAETSSYVPSHCPSPVRTGPARPARSERTGRGHQLGRV